MANDLRLQVIMDLANKASAPLRNIEKSSADAAKALKTARDTLKKLNEQQRAVDGFNAQQAAMRRSADNVKVLQQNLEVLRITHGASDKQVQALERTLAKENATLAKQRDGVMRLRQQLTQIGIGKVSEAQARLKTETTQATQAIERQTAQLRTLAQQRKRLADLNDRHAKEMLHTGMLAGAGVAGQAAGRTMARPVLSAVQTYAQQEGASSQLAGAMMLANGQVSAEFTKINELAMRLGDKLPGTTADFIDMMTMLRRQGLSAQSILGGTGEAAAYLGVQLKMPVAAAAEFAAKMQDATRTTERDMMGLMDLIQRTYYLGVDSGNMLQGFTKLSPTLDTLKKQGLDAANSLAPLLVMMDQTGMAGEASGNGIRKVIQAGLDAKKLGKANDALASAGAGFQLNFVNSKGQFAGLDNLFAQLQKLKGITSDVQRTAVVKELLGDDAETLQVLNTMMDKGLTGYNDVVAKLRAQADLRKRVDAELGTINNLWEATTGTFTNVMAAMGATIAPEVKDFTNWLGEVASNTRAWIAEHPTLVGWLVKTIAVLAALVFGLGTLAIALASVMGPFFVMRFVMGWLGLKFNLWATAIRVVGTALTWLRGVMLFLAANPVVLAITAIVAAIAISAYLIYKHWGRIAAFFSTLWANIVSGLSQTWQHFRAFGGMLIDGLVGGIKARLGALHDAITGAASSAIGWFKEKLGIKSPSVVFMVAGENVGQGAAIGIARSTPLIHQAAAGMVAATAMALPAIATADPTALRLDQRPTLPALPLALSAMATADPTALRLDQRPTLPALPLAVPAMVAADPITPRFDQRPALGASVRQAPVVVQGDTISIHISAAPGADAQAMARAIGAELDRRERAKAARMRSALSDIH